MDCRVYSPLALRRETSAWPAARCCARSARAAAMEEMVRSPPGLSGPLFGQRAPKEGLPGGSYPNRLKGSCRLPDCGRPSAECSSQEWLKDVRTRTHPHLADRLHTPRRRWRGHPSRSRHGPSEKTSFARRGLRSPCTGITGFDWESLLVGSRVATALPGSGRRKHGIAGSSAHIAGANGAQ
jgi:hypothetical protein